MGTLDGIWSLSLAIQAHAPARQQLITLNFSFHGLDNQLRHKVGEPELLALV